jgi:hypothetical protein
VHQSSCSEKWGFRLPHTPGNELEFLGYPEDGNRSSSDLSTARTVAAILRLMAYFDPKYHVRHKDVQT